MSTNADYMPKELNESAMYGTLFDFYARHPKIKFNFVDNISCDEKKMDISIFKSYNSRLRKLQFAIPHFPGTDIFYLGSLFYFIFTGKVNVYSGWNDIGAVHRLKPNTGIIELNELIEKTTLEKPASRLPLDQVLVVLEKIIATTAKELESVAAEYAKIIKIIDANAQFKQSYYAEDNDGSNNGGANIGGTGGGNRTSFVNGVRCNLLSGHTL